MPAEIPFSRKLGRGIEVVAPFYRSNCSSLVTVQGAVKSKEICGDSPEDHTAAMQPLRSICCSCLHAGDEHATALQRKGNVPLQVSLVATDFPPVLTGVPGHTQGTVQHAGSLTNTPEPKGSAKPTSAAPHNAGVGTGRSLRGQREVLTLMSQRSPV